MLALNTGKEMLLDAMLIAIHNIALPMLDMSGYEWSTGVSSNPELEYFYVNWREDAEKLIIVFSDEEPQSFLIPNATSTQISDMITTIPDLNAYVFSTSPTGWNNITNTNTGGYYALAPDTSSMLANLLEILDENVCE